MSRTKFDGPVWLVQPIPYFWEKLRGKWIWEPKIDGWRMQVLRYPDGHAEVWGRRLERRPEWTRKLPKVVRAAEAMLPPGTLLDAELSTRRGRRFIPSVFAAKSRVKPLILVFDVLYHRSRFVATKPLSERKRLLAKMGLEPPFYLVEYSPVSDIASHLATARRQGQEGIVLKKWDSPYPLAQDGPMATEFWRKIK
ncbi:MAG: hypothetical protein HYX86_01930 [Chloroflexi bacterium]|nr:hypothetical protein [Chloroflexota bacterium]